MSNSIKLTDAFKLFHLHLLNQLMWSSCISFLWFQLSFEANSHEHGFNIEFYFITHCKVSWSDSSLSFPEEKITKCEIWGSLKSNKWCSLDGYRFVFTISKLCVELFFLRSSIASILPRFYAQPTLIQPWEEERGEKICDLIRAPSRFFVLPRVFRFSPLRTENRRYHGGKQRREMRKIRKSFFLYFSRLLVSAAVFFPGTLW